MKEPETPTRLYSGRHGGHLIARAALYVYKGVYEVQAMGVAPQKFTDSAAANAAFEAAREQQIAKRKQHAGQAGFALVG